MYVCSLKKVFILKYFEDENDIKDLNVAMIKKSVRSVYCSLYRKAKMKATATMKA